MKEVHVALSSRILPIKAFHGYMKNAKKVNADRVIFVFLSTLEHILTIKIK